MKFTNSMILVVLLSAGAIISLAMAVSDIPAIWSLVLPWLRPPYMHIVINVIIIAIAAVSRFHWCQPSPPVRSRHLISVKTPPPSYYADYLPPPEDREVVEVPEAAGEAYEREDRILELKPVMVNGLEVGADAEEVVPGGQGENALDCNTLTYNTPFPDRLTPKYQSEFFSPADLTGNVSEREEETSRAAHEEVQRGGERRPAPDRHTRKSKSFKERSNHNESPPSRSNSNRRVNASMDRSLTCNSLSPQNPIENIPPGVGETEGEYETLESAWKKIMEGPDRNESPSSSGIGNSISPSQDELNQRVEAFIKKVNNEIRLHRQNSSNQYTQLNSAA